MVKVEIGTLFNFSGIMLLAKLSLEFVESVDVEIMRVKNARTMVIVNLNIVMVQLNLIVEVHVLLKKKTVIELLKEMLHKQHYINQNGD